MLVAVGAAVVVEAEECRGVAVAVAGVLAVGLGFRV